MPIRRYLIEGRVQGVGFRYFTRRTARRLGIAGYVRNLPDGSVEALARGSDADLEALERRLREGPPGARVESVGVSEATGTFSENDFIIR